MAFICLMTIQQPHVCFLKRGKGVFGSQWWFQANYNRRLLTFYFVAVISFLLGHLINLSSSYLNLCVLGCKRIEYFFLIYQHQLYFFFTLVLPSFRWNKFHCYCVFIYSRPHVPPFRNTHTWKKKYTDFTWQREKEFFQCSYGTFAILVVCKY